MSAMSRSVAEAHGFEFVGCELLNSPEGKIVRVYIDSADGIDHEACGAVSRDISDRLDALEESGTVQFASTYFIEVSSPGIERPLFTPEHYQRFVGSSVEVSRKGGKKLAGTLSRADGDGISLKLADGTLVDIGYDVIRKGKLLYTFGKKKGE